MRFHRMNIGFCRGAKERERGFSTSIEVCSPGFVSGKTPLDVQTFRCSKIHLVVNGRFEFGVSTVKSPKVSFFT